MDLLVVLFLFCRVAGGLRHVELQAPIAVATGTTATLLCLYDLEGDPLYSVKWYKGREEFFRYMPKETPKTRIFPLPEVNVDMSISGANQVVLRDLHNDLTGKYRCEVSTDAPDFHTQVVSAQMNVVKPLTGKPILKMEKTSYSVGDTLRGNCTSPPSSPPANISWLINDNKINSSFEVRSTKEGKDPVRIAGLQLEVNTFLGGKLKIICVSDLYEVFRSQQEVWLDEERPRLASVLGTRESAEAGCSRNIFCPGLWSQLVFVLLVSFR